MRVRRRSPRRAPRVTRPRRVRRIKNLLKELMPLSEEIELARYRDKRIAIDGAGWLYRGWLVARRSAACCRKPEPLIATASVAG